VVVFFNVFFPLNNKNNKGVGNFSNKTQWQKYLQLTAKHFLPFGRRDFTFVSLLLFYCFILLFHFFPLLLRPTLRMSYLYLNYWHLKLLLEGMNVLLGFLISIRLVTEQGEYQWMINEGIFMSI